MHLFFIRNIKIHQERLMETAVIWKKLPLSHIKISTLASGAFFLPDSINSWCSSRLVVTTLTNQCWCSKGATHTTPLFLLLNVATQPRWFSPSLFTPAQLTSGAHFILSTCSCFYFCLLLFVKFWRGQKDAFMEASPSTVWPGFSTHGSTPFFPFNMWKCCSLWAKTKCYF